MVYLDYNASTPVDPVVAAALTEWTQTIFANPSSGHGAGQRAASLIERARQQVADLAGTSARSVVFTSGASESANLALLGLGLGARGQANCDMIISATEHKAVRAAAELAVQLSGGVLRVVRVLRDGRIDLDDLEQCMRETQPAAVIVMHANNETGVINPLGQVRALIPEYVPLVVDLTQSAGKIGIDVPFDIGFFSSHKMYGPKGAGALIADRHMQERLTPVFAGGGQERGLRGGTTPAPLIGAFGLAAQLASESLRTDAEHASQLLDLLRQGLEEVGMPLVQNGSQAPRIPNTINLRFPGIDAEAIMANAPDLEISDGSACTSANPHPSHVLMAMGLTRAEASESLRISIGRPTTEDELRYAIEVLGGSVTRLAARVGVPA